MRRSKTIDDEEIRSLVPVRLELLGSFSLAVGGRPVLPPFHVQRLLAFLAIQGRSLHRAYVAGRLWPASGQEQAFGCLRTALWRMRGLRAPLVTASPTHLELAPEVSLDLDRVTAAVDRVLAREALPESHDLEALVHAGELLPDWYEDWVADAREQLCARRILALETACGELLETSRTAEAATLALAAVAADPLRESARRVLIMCDLREGNLAHARQEYGAFCARLKRELGLAPSPRLEELVRELGAAPR